MQREIDQFLAHLGSERNVSAHTLAAYRVDLGQFREFVQADRGAEAGVATVDTCWCGAGWPSSTGVTKRAASAGSWRPCALSQVSAARGMVAKNPRNWSPLPSGKRRSLPPGHRRGDRPGGGAGGRGPSRPTGPGHPGDPLLLRGAGVRADRPRCRRGGSGPGVGTGPGQGGKERVVPVGRQAGRHWPPT